MSAKNELMRIEEEFYTGWNPQTIISLLCEFIDEHHGEGELESHLRPIAQSESETDVESMTVEELREEAESHFSDLTGDEGRQWLETYVKEARGRKAV